MTDQSQTARALGLLRMIEEAARAGQRRVLRDGLADAARLRVARSAAVEVGELAAEAMDATEPDDE